MVSYPIESLLSARLFLNPQLVDERLFFISDLSGRLSLYAMDAGGSVPEPLLPPSLALHNPALMGGYPFIVFPKLGKIIVMLDRDGDENYQPHVIPIEGGIPEPLFGERFAGMQLTLTYRDLEHNLLGLSVDQRKAPEMLSYLVRLDTLEMIPLGESLYGNSIMAVSPDHQKVILADGYLEGDVVLFLWEAGKGERRLLYGKPLEARAPDEEVPLTGIRAVSFTADGEGLLLIGAIFEDRYGLIYMPLSDPQALRPIPVEGYIHQGIGEMVELMEVGGERFMLKYNINGVSYAYEGTFDAAQMRFVVDTVLTGVGELSEGVVQSITYEPTSGRYALAFSSATSPVQLYTLEKGVGVVQHTRERILGIPSALLAPGEDATFVSHDGLTVAARLYLPAEGLGYAPPYPVIFYIHGGPQSQEKPDFTWFSMPLIQYFTLNGFAVFVPNVRGSSGYGLDYVKRVDRDWGGQDRLDHVAAFEHLKQDPRLDMTRAGVMGRSYGGYMTLMQVGCHPELWKAACDMFGPYNLLTFLERIPETWKTYFHIALGHPDKDRDFLLERSPSTHLHNLACPLLVIQGRNDPRVRAAESEDLVAELRAQGKQVELIIFEDEGHDVLKFNNKVRCYTEIVAFFKRHLMGA